MRMVWYLRVEALVSRERTFHIITVWAAAMKRYVDRCGSSSEGSFRSFARVSRRSARSFKLFNQIYPLHLSQFEWPVLINLSPAHFYAKSKFKVDMKVTTPMYIMFDNGQCAPGRLPSWLLF